MVVLIVQVFKLSQVALTSDIQCQANVKYQWVMVRAFCFITVHRDIDSKGILRLKLFYLHFDVKITALIKIYVWIL